MYACLAGIWLSNTAFKFDAHRTLPPKRGERCAVVTTRANMVWEKKGGEQGWREFTTKAVSHRIGGDKGGRKAAKTRQERAGGLKEWSGYFFSGWCVSHEGRRKSNNKSG
jgi:hypothetical protein